MSKRRQVRHRDRHDPFRKAKPTKRSASGPDHIAGASDVAIYFREDCRTLRDSLQLEMVVAQYLLRMQSVRTPEGVPVGDATIAGVIADLEGHGDELSHAILRGLAHIGTGDAARRASDAAARLGVRGVGLPREFADVAEARAAGAWRQTEGACDGEYALFVDFVHPQGRGHSVALFVESRRGGTVKHIGLMHPVSDFDCDELFHPSAMETLELEVAGALLREVLERSFGSRLDMIDDYRVPLAMARARAMTEGDAAAELSAA
jgi:hypothetical protein